MSKVRDAEIVTTSLTGTESVSLDHVGQTYSINGVKSPSPDLRNYVVAGISAEGSYRWYVRGRDWWMVKAISIPQTPGKDPGVNRHVIRNYKDQILSSTDFKDDGGHHYFLSGHLDRKESRAADGPMIGRRWTGGGGC